MLTETELDHQDGQHPRSTADGCLQRTLAKLREILNGCSRPRRPSSIRRAITKYPSGALLQALKRVLVSLGLQGHVHTLRHAFISAAITGGIPEAIVRQWVGHVDPQILRLYTHVADVQSREAMQRLGQLLNRQQGGQS